MHDGKPVLARCEGEAVRQTGCPEPTLTELFDRHQGKVSDRWSSYLDYYHQLLEGYRNRPVSLLEIGIQNGGSLEIWAKYFPQADKLVGCDINPDCALLDYDDPRIAVVVGDANADAAYQAILAHAPAFDMIIDDGSHRSGDIVRSFARYFPHLSHGGLYIVEDLHCSYWEKFEGGLYDPFSSMTFFKRLVDVVNHEHWGIDRAPQDILAGFCSKYDVQVQREAVQSIHSVEFRNSLCVIRKRHARENRLNLRKVRGTEALVSAEALVRDAAPIRKRDQAGNAWTARDMAPDEELASRLTELADLSAEVERLKGRDAEARELAGRLEAREGEMRELASTLAAALTARLNTREAQAKELKLSLEARDRQVKVKLGKVEKKYAEMQNHLRLSRRRPIANLRHYLKWKGSRFLLRFEGIMTKNIAARMWRRVRKYEPPQKVRLSSATATPKVVGNVIKTLEPKDTLRNAFPVLTVANLVGHVGQHTAAVSEVKQVIVYTCLFGDYEDIKEPAFPAQDNVQYLLFTDRADIQSERWEIIRIPESLDDLRRLSRLPKILAHKYLPPHKISIYIDCSLLWRVENTIKLAEDLLGEHDIALFKH